jgi:hypothetical protein
MDSDVEESVDIVQSENVFFSRSDRVDLLKSLKVKLEAMQVKQDDESIKVNKALSQLIDFILVNSIGFDKYCVFNIKKYGGSFFNNAVDFTRQPASYFASLDVMIKLFIPFYAFFKEHELFASNIFNPDFDGIELIDYVLSDEWHVSKELKSKLLYIFYQMPADILLNRLSNPNLKSVEQFDEILAKAEKLKNEWDAELVQKEKKVAELHERLNKQEKAFNFVALDRGFSHLEQDKKKSIKFSFYSLAFIAACILGILGVEIYIVWDAVQYNYEVVKNGQQVNNLINLNDYAYLVLPTLAIEVILIYFFRVVLSNYNSLKTQILQIELRRSLCQFIQSYADYAKEINDKSAGTLERFEQIIFSGIVSDPDKVTTYDGIESLANMVKAIKG